MKRTTPNARFWYFHRSGWVRMTLRPGQSLHHSRSFHNGEGWSCESFTLTHEGDHITEEYCDSGSDCDGRHRSGGMVYAKLPLVATVPAWNSGGTDHLHNGEHIMRPEWTKAKTWQRDYTAEAAGY